MLDAIHISNIAWRDLSGEVKMEHAPRIYYYGLKTDLVTGSDLQLAGPATKSV